MAILKKKEIANMSEKELGDKLKSLRTELLRANAQRATRQNVGKMREIKRTIARILTALKKKTNQEIKQSKK